MLLKINKRNFQLNQHHQFLNSILLLKNDHNNESIEEKSIRLVLSSDWQALFQKVLNLYLSLNLNLKQLLSFQLYLKTPSKRFL
ncbi:unnamed protein product [[Candida] boidinii]|nr:unnamed protein product [[Candida] boidinii]